MRDQDSSKTAEAATLPTPERAQDLAKQWAAGLLDDAGRDELFMAARSRECSILMMGHMLGIGYRDAQSLCAAAEEPGQ